MLYAVLCYHAESTVSALSKDEDDALMAGIAVVKERLASQGKLAAAVRLMPTTAATTVREGRDMLVIDGPFAETKEQLLGFYVIDCASLEEAIEATRALAEPRVAAGLAGALEIRPMASSSLLRTA
jgi:hypothetical protein